MYASYSDAQEGLKKKDWFELKLMRKTKSSNTNKAQPLLAWPRHHPTIEYLYNTYLPCVQLLALHKHSHGPSTVPICACHQLLSARCHAHPIMCQAMSQALYAGSRHY